MPTMISGNLTGPILAMAGRAAELILDNQPAERVRNTWGATPNVPPARPLARHATAAVASAPRRRTAVKTTPNTAAGAQDADERRYRRGGRAPALRRRPRIPPGLGRIGWLRPRGRG